MVLGPEAYRDQLFMAHKGRRNFSEIMDSAGNKLDPRIKYVLNLAKIKEGMQVVDLACGHGELLAGAATRGSRGIGLDFSDDCLKHCREIRNTLPVEAQEKIFFIKGDVTRLPFGDNSCDRIFLSNIVEHLDEQQLQNCLRESYRCIKPKGYIIIHTLPNRWAIDYGYKLLRLIKPALPFDPRSEYEKLVHINEQSIVSLSKHLKITGFHYHIWLDNLSAPYAKWSKETDYLDPLRNIAYPIFRNRFNYLLLNLLLFTPVRYIATNDIFVIAKNNRGSRYPISGSVKLKSLFDRLLVSLINSYKHK